MGALIGEMIALSLMALALGMDAFSVALGMGLLRLRLRQIFYIGLTIGLFHIFMPLVGMAVGRFLSREFGSIATYAGGVLLLWLGGQMIVTSFQQEEGTSFLPHGAGLLFLHSASASTAFRSG